jgi:16S rRNA (guanine527-N7)-methyltransferase
VSRHDPLTNSHSRTAGSVRALLLDEFGVSRETLHRLDLYVDILLQWQQRINLISPATIPELWSRHVLDSVQLVRLKPDARQWVDLGSGGGLPGLVIACFLAETADGRIHLIESNGKKAAFLRHVAITLSLPAEIHAQRIEEVIPNLPQPDVVTARALATLDQLIGYSNLLLKRGAIGLFLKGRDVDGELTAAQRNWHLSYTLHQSVTEPTARIVEITMV